MGEVTRGKFGGGFLYTNRDSLSLGIVVGIGDMMEGRSAVQAPTLLDEFKQRPEIACLIRGGQTVEYAAHVVPEGGFKAIGRLYGDGILVAGDAAGLAMNIGVSVRGMEYALASGFYAAQAVLKTRESGNYSAASLKVYQDLLEASFVLKDFRSFQHTPEVLSNPRFLQYYPELVGNMMRDLYAIPAGPKDKLSTTMKRYMGVGDLLAMAGDLRKVMKI
jgi:electron transfer flavoprotein-quinone oxidoreductase